MVNIGRHVHWPHCQEIWLLSRHLAKPCKKVVLVAKRVTKYLRCTRDLVITWSTQSDGTANWKMTGSVDASFANCQMTRRSHGDWINFLNRGPVSWKSGLQPIVTLSNCESEYVTLSMEVCEVTTGRFKQINTKFRFGRDHFWRSSQNSLHTIRIQLLRHSHKASNWGYVPEDDRNVSGIKR